MKTQCINNCTSISTGYSLSFLQGITLTPALFSKLKYYWQRYTTRQQLAKLTGQQLLDIGLTPEQVEAEIKKPFWR